MEPGVSGATWLGIPPGELREEALHAVFVLRDVRIDFAVGAFEVGVGDEAGSTVAGTGDVDDAEVLLLDDAVQMNVDEVQSGCGPPVAEEARLDVFALEWLFEQRVVEEVNLPDGEVVGRPPVGINLAEKVCGQGLIHGGSFG
jgi:hypothetical protein